LANLALGAERIAGKLQVSSDETTRSVTGTLAASALDLTETQQLILSSSTDPAADTESTRWSRQRFALSALRGLKLNVGVTAKSLAIADITKLDTAQLRLTSAGDTDAPQVTLSILDGTAPLGGRVTGKIEIAAADVGANVKGTIQGQNFALRPVAGTSANGTADFNMSFSGRGLSPQATVALLDGQGAVRLRSAVFGALDPAGVGAAAKAVPANGQIEPAEFQATLRRELAARTLAIGSQQVAFTIKDGILNLDGATVKAATGSAENRTTVDLGKLLFESNWTLKAAPGEGEKPLPPVIARYAGPLDGIAQAVPTYLTDELLREMIVRRLEGNVAELERLRQSDEAQGATELAPAGPGTEQRERAPRLLQQRDSQRRLPETDERVRDQSFRLTPDRLKSRAAPRKRTAKQVRTRPLSRRPTDRTIIRLGVGRRVTRRARPAQTRARTGVRLPSERNWRERAFQSD
ncbi:MAG: hypothetical protein AAFO62_09145, partial [Pseudomonadota bacterium]